MKALRLSTLALTLASFGSAWAVPVTINATADNAILNGGVCVEVDCDPYDLAVEVFNGSETNAGNWRNADSVTFDLAPGTYGIAFAAQNFGTGSSGNPAGFLAEILWGGNTSVTSSAWDVTIDGTNWVSATEWAQNGSGIWGGNLLGEISSDAYWLWTANNFDATTDRIAGFRTTITIDTVDVAEPGTLALFGIGMIGLGFARRRR